VNPIWSTPGFSSWPEEEKAKHQNGIKVDRPVELSNIIRVPVLGSGNKLYSLVAAIEHRTNDTSISTGHYICYLKFRDEWYFANDRQRLTRMSDGAYHDVRKSFIFLYKKNSEADSGAGWD
jgi:ubiquitin C-terminal hydrolase